MEAQSSVEKKGLTFPDNWTEKDERASSEVYKEEASLKGIKQKPWPGKKPEKRTA